jgi:single-stranded DNA-binding protein
MIDVLAQGRLVRAPERRTSATGKDYATALLAVATEGDDSLLASCVAFRPEAVAALLALDKGDAAAITGRAKLRTWTAGDGALKTGLSVVVDQVLTLYAVKRKREAVQGAADAPERPQSRERGSAGATPRRSRPAAPSSRQHEPAPWDDLPNDL